MEPRQAWTEEEQQRFRADNHTECTWIVQARFLKHVNDSIDAALLERSAGLQDTLDTSFGYDTAEVQTRHDQLSNDSDALYYGFMEEEIFSIIMGVAASEEKTTLV